MQLKSVKSYQYLPPKTLPQDVTIISNMQFLDLNPGFFKKIETFYSKSDKQMANAIALINKEKQIGTIKLAADLAPKKMQWRFYALAAQTLYLDRKPTEALKLLNEILNTRGCF